MFKKLFKVIFIGTLALMFLPACAEQDNDAKAIAGTAPAVEGTEPAAKSGEKQDSVMDQPVNFSTPEDVEKSIERVRQEAGDSKARDLTNALGYILTYDLSVGHDKEKMYKKLNGRTPNAIIAKMKR